MARPVTISGGQQDDATEPHRLKRRATNFWPWLRTSLARLTWTKVLVSGARLECTSDCEWALWRMGADFCFFNHYFLVQC